MIVYWGPSEVVKIMNLNKDDMVYLEMAVEFKSGNRKKSGSRKAGHQLKECFVKYFLAVQFRGSKGHLGSF